MGFPDRHSQIRPGLGSFWTPHLGPGALRRAITRLDEGGGLSESLGSDDGRRPYGITSAGFERDSRTAGGKTGFDGALGGRGCTRTARDDENAENDNESGDAEPVTPRPINSTDRRLTAASSHR
jgi:hypothetical protein